MSTPPGAIITGGDFQGLAILRSLKRHGIPTFVTDHEHCISRYSRDLQRFATSPSPFQMEAYVDFLMELAPLNWAPIAGRVRLLRHIKGLFLSLKQREAILENERVLTVIDNGQVVVV